MKLALSGPDRRAGQDRDGQTQTQMGLGLCLPWAYCLVGGSHDQSFQMQGAAHGSPVQQRGALSKPAWGR